MGGLVRLGALGMSGLALRGFSAVPTLNMGGTLGFGFGGFGCLGSVSADEHGGLAWVWVRRVPPWACSGFGGFINEPATLNVQVASTAIRPD